MTSKHFFNNLKTHIQMAKLVRSKKAQPLMAEPLPVKTDIHTELGKQSVPEPVAATSPAPVTVGDVDASEAVAAHEDPIRQSAASLHALVNRDDVREIMKNATLKRHEKNYRLSLLGLTRNEISFITQSTAGNVSRDIWAYNKGLKKLTTDA